MTYVLVALFLVWRVFGISNTVSFLSKLIDSFSTGISKKDQVPTAIQERMAAKALAEPWSKKPEDIFSRVAHSELTKPKKRPKSKRALSSIRLVQNSGRSSEEILAGKPDFGWRRHS